MLVKLQDGKCRSCGGQLEIVGADDATLDVECTECGDGYTVEPDAFNDGGIKSWPVGMVQFGGATLMDPEAALAELVQSVQCRDWDRVEEVANGLLSWLEHRGFPPVTIGPRELGDEWHRSIAIFACHLATSKVRDIRRRRHRRTGE